MHRNPLLASPPATIRYNTSTSLPTPDAIEDADVNQLKAMLTEAIKEAKEARTAAAHFKLQYNLLDMESQEAAQRAEIEHQMTRKEMEVLRTVEQRHRSGLASAARNSAPPPSAQIEAITQTCKSLEDERDQAERRLERAKRLIELEKDRTELLAEENELLKRRIRENREHFTRFKSQSPNWNTPRDLFTTPHQRMQQRFPESTSSHQPFAALLAADQVLSGESMSVPSTPTRTHTSKLKHGHTRGAHSLSSLHTTPVRTRPVTSDGSAEVKYPMSAPGPQFRESAERERQDRDSTISVSDEEPLYSDDEIQQSQASSLATDMLRKNPGSQESLRLSQGAERSSNALQSKIFGHVRKPVPSDSASSKRRGSFDDNTIKAKKARLAGGVGLGIKEWNNV